MPCHASMAYRPLQRCPGTCTGTKEAEATHGKLRALVLFVQKMRSYLMIGLNLACAAFSLGAKVTLLMNSPEVISDVCHARCGRVSSWQLLAGGVHAAVVKKVSLQLRPSHLAWQYCPSCDSLRGGPQPRHFRHLSIIGGTGEVAGGGHYS